MQTGTLTGLSGEVEVGETFIGGKARNMHKDKRAEKITGRGAAGKAIVLGVLEWDGRVRTKVIPDTRKGTVQAEVRARVKPGSLVCTGALKSYEGLAPGYIHEAVDGAAEYVRGNWHTNGLENYRSMLKRCIRGTYVNGEPFHLSCYLDEENFSTIGSGSAHPQHDRRHPPERVAQYPGRQAVGHPAPHRHRHQVQFTDRREPAGQLPEPLRPGADHHRATPFGTPIRPLSGPPRRPAAGLHPGVTVRTAVACPLPRPAGRDSM
jgi:hypothetical protein